MNENGLITVTIRGGDDDVQNAKRTIEGMTADLLVPDTQQEPVVQKEYEIIDWKAAAAQSVSSLPFPIKAITQLREILTERTATF